MHANITKNLLISFCAFDLDQNTNSTIMMNIGTEVPALKPNELGSLHVFTNQTNNISNAIVNLAGWIFVKRLCNQSF